MINKHALAATVTTLVIFGVCFGIAGVIYLAKHYAIAENILGWSLAAFGVFTIWMNIYNESKIQENGDGWGCR